MKKEDIRQDQKHESQRKKEEGPSDRAFKNEKENHILEQALPIIAASTSTRSIYEKERFQDKKGLRAAPILRNLRVLQERLHYHDKNRSGATVDRK